MSKRERKIALLTAQVTTLDSAKCIQELEAINARLLKVLGWIATATARKQLPITSEINEIAVAAIRQAKEAAH